MKNILIGVGILATLVVAVLLAKIVGVFFALCVGLAIAILVGAFYMGWLDWAFGAVTSSGRGRTALIIVVVYFLGFLGLALFEAGSRMYMAAQNNRHSPEDQVAMEQADAIPMIDDMPEAAFHAYNGLIDQEIKKKQGMQTVFSYRGSLAQAYDKFMPALVETEPAFAQTQLDSLIKHEQGHGAYRDEKMLNKYRLSKARAMEVLVEQLRAKASGKSVTTSAPASNGVGLTMQTTVGNKPSFRFDAWTGLGTAPEQPAVRDTVRIILPGTIVRDTVTVPGKTIVVSPPNPVPTCPPISSIPDDTLATQDSWERMIGATSVPFPQSPR